MVRLCRGGGGLQLQFPAPKRGGGVKGGEDNCNPHLLGGGNMLLRVGRGGTCRSRKGRYCSKSGEKVLLKVGRKGTARSRKGRYCSESGEKVLLEVRREGTAQNREGRSWAYFAVRELRETSSQRQGWLAPPRHRSRPGYHSRQPRLRHQSPVWAAPGSAPLPAPHPPPVIIRKAGILTRN